MLNGLTNIIQLSSQKSAKQEPSPSAFRVSLEKQNKTKIDSDYCSDF